jgi:hypothetical protein
MVRAWNRILALAFPFDIVSGLVKLLYDGFLLGNAGYSIEAFAKSFSVSTINIITHKLNRMACSRR